MNLFRKTIGLFPGLDLPTWIIAHWKLAAGVAILFLATGVGLIMFVSSFGPEKPVVMVTATPRPTVPIVPIGTVVAKPSVTPKLTPTPKPTPIPTPTPIPVQVKAIGVADVPRLDFLHRAVILLSAFFVFTIWMEARSRGQLEDGWVVIAGAVVLFLSASSPGQFKGVAQLWGGEKIAAAFWLGALFITVISGSIDLSPLGTALEAIGIVGFLSGGLGDIGVLLGIKPGKVYPLTAVVELFNQKRGSEAVFSVVILGMLFAGVVMMAIEMIRNREGSLAVLIAAISIGAYVLVKSQYSDAPWWVALAIAFLVSVVGSTLLLLRRQGQPTRPIGGSIQLGEVFKNLVVNLSLPWDSVLLTICLMVSTLVAMG